MNADTCPHLCTVPDAVTNYFVILASYVEYNSDETLKRKSSNVHCYLCKAADKRLHACLNCTFFGCLDYENGVFSHIKDHAIKNEHYFAITVNHGFIFCFICDDYIYNETFDDILSNFKLEASKDSDSESDLPPEPKARRIDDSESDLPSEPKARRITPDSEFDIPWEPKTEETVLTETEDTVEEISQDLFTGLRGIINTGNSCYINCIIQVLVHTPILKDFFLSEKHMCFLPDSCLTCEMYNLFQEFHCGISDPYDPSKKFFQVLQKFCNTPLGLQQQDCFELFQEILIGLHASCQKTHKMDITDCNCVIHQIFYGINQSSKECSQCKSSSFLPLDHFMDILLDLDGKDDSLLKILNRKYFEPQLLSDYTCSECKQINTTYLYQSIKKLPAVICFRMNCFMWDSEDSGIRQFQKKSTAFAFEEWIDMSFYLNAKGDIELSSEACALGFNTNENRYRLFAVIFHKGDLQNGHYSTYVRLQSDKWYECDDSFISERSLEEVLKCEPFLLFYCKNL
ncbi:ubiquitin carboxyl-terminal hydrolase 22-A-like [Argiope bruennichi]|uniref:Ubiquitin carboxyl-terminal hydrolase n=1 Tax=Argiope bruennichi TaxID=94029 RepID=A0A8T0EZY1_ARGBR|nr:ubiquitin carboxyl-terminal hydrolase 22-A-like [Argiope bruennichi]KAF8784367.1 Ubiquitin carboxyl-terminal hydrolase 22 like protein [Argiope bruennichi]